MMLQLRVARLLLLCLVITGQCGQRVFAFPHSEGRAGGGGGGGGSAGVIDDVDTEIVMVEEVFRYSDAATNSTAALITLDEPCSAEREREHDQSQDPLNGDGDNESVIDAVDDLIFAAKKPPQQQQQQPQQLPHEIDVLTSDEEESLTSAASGASAEREGGAATPAVDMSDFVALIPAARVKSIAANYYRNDPEVQRAYAFLSGRDFAALQQHIIAVPEMAAFLRYLNASGFDLVGFLHTLTNLTDRANEATSPAANEVEDDNLRPRFSPAATPPMTGTGTGMGMEMGTGMETTTVTPHEQLNGLHGLVDSILDALPQDQILTTFFDKLEANEPFSKLVSSIGSPAFAKVLSNMENSVPLRNLIFTLHNNGIYITRIVDSLKAYFFLGTF